MKTKQESIQVWLEATDAAIEALRSWRAYLQLWQQSEEQVDHDFFNSIINDMDRRANLFLWMDASEAGLDDLTEVLTGWDWGGDDQETE
ncbi:MAG: hypothetical protein KDJ52_08580 [Anaerolineae bacterium]|nr:hypothetical protein [Anaerolineae bacterium]